MDTRCSLRGASFSWPEGREILRPTTADWFFEGVTGLCGPNGCGKSTLLALLSGELEPAAGSISLSPAPARRLEQRLGGLSRSPGQRQRERLEEFLHREEGGLLLLDEPANHLDGAARADLERHLRRCGTPVLLVSHDRELVDRICRKVLWLEDGGLHVTEGGFSKAWEAREARFARSLSLRGEQDAREAALRARIQAGREAQQGAGRDRTAGRRMKDANDRDATSMAADFRFRSAQATLGGRQGRMSGELARLESQARVEVRRDTLRDVEFPPDPRGWSRRISLPAGDVEGEDGFRLRQGGISLDARARVRLRGPNGSGKSTLLRALARAAPPGTAFLPQEPTLEEDRSLLAEASRLEKAEMGRFLSLVAALGASPAALRGSAAPSPGEARKLRLALALSRPAWMLLLDEPTNHLDAPCAQRLEEALVRWNGGLVLCTHDERLARALSLEEWRLDDGRMRQG